MILGLTGDPDSGKDTVADVLVRDHGWVRMSLGDAARRAAAAWYGWDPARFWGDPAWLDEPDVQNKDLTPNKVLAYLQNELPRGLDPLVWLRATLTAAKRVEAGWSYTPQEGAVQRHTGFAPPRPGVVIPDVTDGQYFEPFAAAHGFLVRVQRPGGQDQEPGPRDGDVSPGAPEGQAKPPADGEDPIHAAGQDEPARLTFENKGPLHELPARVADLLARARREHWRPPPPPPAMAPPEG